VEDVGPRWGGGLTGLLPGEGVDPQVGGLARQRPVEAGVDASQGVPQLVDDTVRDEQPWARFFRDAVGQGEGPQPEWLGGEDARVEQDLARGGRAGSW